MNKLPQYEKYKDSGVEWLGEVPEHWNVKPLFSVGTERSESNKGMLEDNLLSLSYGRIVTKDINTNEGLLPESFETYQIVHPGDIVFRLTDLQNDKRSLRTAIVTEDGIITSAYTTVNPVGILSEYMNYLLRAYDVQKVFYSMGSGLRQSMKFADLKWLPVLTPSIHEQHAIATFLDRETAKIDALVEEQERMIDLLKERRQTVTCHAVTKGLNPNAKMKYSSIKWLEEIPEHWESKRAAYLFNLKKDQDHPDEQLLSVYRDYGVIPKETRDDNFNKASENLSIYQLVHVGDLVMNRMKTWQGSIGVSKYQGIVSPDYYVASPVEDFDLDYMHHLLRSKPYIAHYGTLSNGVRVNQWRLNFDEFRTIKVLLPPLDEQREISSFIEKETAKIDGLIQEAEKAIELLIERRSALISATVTGKIDVRGLVEVTA